MLVEIIVDSCEGLPATFEVEGVGAVDILLALVAEAGPDTELREHIAWVELDDTLAHTCGDVVREAVAQAGTILEVGRHIEVFVFRTLQGEEAVEVEALERVQHDVCCPAEGLDGVGRRDGDDIGGVVLVGELRVTLVVVFLM